MGGVPVLEKIEENGGAREASYFRGNRKKWSKCTGATSPLSRGTLKSKGGGTLSLHFYADGDTIETVFRTIISVNQLSIYGAVPGFVLMQDS